MTWNAAMRAARPAAFAWLCAFSRFAYSHRLEQRHRRRCAMPTLSLGLRFIEHGSVRNDSSSQLAPRGRLAQRRRIAAQGRGGRPRFAGVASARFLPARLPSETAQQGRSFLRRSRPAEPASRPHILASSSEIALSGRLRRGGRGAWRRAAPALSAMRCNSSRSSSGSGRPALSARPMERDHRLCGEASRRDAAAAESFDLGGAVFRSDLASIRHETDIRGFQAASALARRLRDPRGDARRDRVSPCLLGHGRPVAGRDETRLIATVMAMHTHARRALTSPSPCDHGRGALAVFSPCTRALAGLVILSGGAARPHLPHRG